MWRASKFISRIEEEVCQEINDEDRDILREIRYTSRERTYLFI